MAEVNYTLSKSQDVYTILNNEASNTTYTLRKENSCKAELALIEEGEITPTSNYTPTLTQDGIYILTLLNGENESSITFLYYLNLQLSYLEDIFSVLCSCDCGCANCEDLGVEDYKALLVTRTKLDAYKRLVSPQYVASFDAVNKVLPCIVDPELYCEIAKEGITGQLQYNEKLIKELIAIDYLTLYFTDIRNADEVETSYINTKYNSVNILCCINSLGVDINKIKTIIEDMGAITILSGAYVNQPPSVVGDNSITVDNRAVTTLTLAMFTTLTTPAYVDPEGDPVADIRIDTLPADGVLELNGVAVTAGQIIPVVDINNSLLTYTSPDQDALDNDVFNFSVRDTGSGLFSS